MSEDSFLSVERLVEFGMSMAIAQQMVGAMNESMKAMYVPGSDISPVAANATIFYAIIDNSQVGPLSEKDVSQLLLSKKISRDTYMWTPSQTKWKAAKEIPEVLRIVALAPPPFEP